MIGGFVIEGALVGAAGCAVWEVAVIARRWLRDRRRLHRLASYLDKTGGHLRDVALHMWRDQSLRGPAHSVLDVSAEVEAAATRCRGRIRRPRREYAQQLSNLLAASQLLRRTAHDPKLFGSTEAASLNVVADSFRRTVLLSDLVEPRFTVAPRPNAASSTPPPRASAGTAYDAVVLGNSATEPSVAAQAATTGLASAREAVQRPVRLARDRGYTGRHREYNGKHRVE